MQRYTNSPIQTRNKYKKISTGYKKDCQMLFGNEHHEYREADLRYSLIRFLSSIILSHTHL